MIVFKIKKRSFLIKNLKLKIENCFKINNLKLKINYCLLLIKNYSSLQFVIPKGPLRGLVIGIWLLVIVPKGSL